MESKVFYRRISYPLWPTAEEIISYEKSKNSFPLSSVNIDFRSKDNTLSLWQLSTPMEAAVAMVNNNSRFEDMFFVKIPVEKLEEKKINYIQENGNSLFNEYNGNHFNIINVNYFYLGEIIELILSAIKSGEYEIITSHELKKYIKNLVDSKQFNIKTLPKPLQEQLLSVK